MADKLLQLQWAYCLVARLGWSLAAFPMHQNAKHVSDPETDLAIILGLYEELGRLPESAEPATVSIPRLFETGRIRTIKDLEVELSREVRDNPYALLTRDGRSNLSPALPGFASVTRQLMGQARRQPQFELPINRSVKHSIALGRVKAPQACIDVAVHVRRGDVSSFNLAHGFVALAEGNQVVFDGQTHIQHTPLSTFDDAMAEFRRGGRSVVVVSDGSTLGHQHALRRLDTIARQAMTRERRQLLTSLRDELHEIDPDREIRAFADENNAQLVLGDGSNRSVVEHALLLASANTVAYSKSMFPRVAKRYFGSADRPTLLNLSPGWKR